jgi:hypothetical protein
MIMRSVCLLLHTLNIPLAGGDSHRSTLSSITQAMDKLTTVNPLRHWLLVPGHPGTQQALEDTITTLMIFLQ